MLLAGQVLLKIGSTGYRFARYYTGAVPYVRKGPPAPLLRLLGPVVVLTSCGVNLSPMWKTHGVVTRSASTSAISTTSTAFSSVIRPRRCRGLPARNGPVARPRPGPDPVATRYLLPDGSGESGRIRPAGPGALCSGDCWPGTGPCLVRYAMDVGLTAATTASVTQLPMRSSSSAPAADSACPNPGTIHSSFGSFAAS